MNEQDCIRRCQTGDVLAFEPIFRSHINMAVRTAFLIARDWTVAEDAAQEAMTRAFQSIRSFRVGQPFAPWLYRIVVNEARRVARRSRRHLATATVAVPEALMADAPSPEGVVMARERQVQLWRAIDSLDEDHRIVLILKYFRGFSEAEIAMVLALRQSTVKSRLHVARQRLLARLDTIEELIRT